MRLVSFEIDGRAGFGVLKDDTVLDVSKAVSVGGGSLRHFLRTGGTIEAIKEAAEGARPLSAATLRQMTPLPDCDRIFCVGLNYRGHAEEAGLPIPARPSFFIRLASSLVAHGKPCVLPAASQQFDFEGELAVVIGRGGRNIPVAQAPDHALGYACFADNSVRDWQRHGTQATAGKNFESSGAFGPWIVTCDEVPDVQSLAIVTRLNGEVVQQDNTANMVFGVAELIAYVSCFTSLEPGDVIVTGTPAGVGFTRNPPLFLKAGDMLEVDIACVGTLANPITAEAETTDAT